MRYSINDHAVPPNPLWDFYIDEHILISYNLITHEKFGYNGYVNFEPYSINKPEESRVGKYTSVCMNEVCTCSFPETFEERWMYGHFTEIGDTRPPWWIFYTYITLDMTTLYWVKEGELVKSPSGYFYKGNIDKFENDGDDVSCTQKPLPFPGTCVGRGPTLTWHMTCKNKPHNLFGWVIYGTLFSDDNGISREFYAEWEIKFNKPRKDTKNDGFIVYGTIYNEMMEEQPKDWKKYVVRGKRSFEKPDGFIGWSFEGDAADISIRNVKFYVKQRCDEKMCPLDW